MATQKLNLTRDQLATFLKSQEQIKQFEKLFQTVDTLEPIVGTDFEFAADTAQAAATEALAQIAVLTQSLELLALAPVRNNIELEHDVNGILPFANLPASVRSNQVLTWLSM
jgi:hypothetical protein